MAVRHLPRGLEIGSDVETDVGQLEASVLDAVQDASRFLQVPPLVKSLENDNQVVASTRGLAPVARGEAPNGVAPVLSPGQEDDCGFSRVAQLD